ncbi:MAG: leucine--tRNA ligase [Gammaproteobacteria bacterium]
MNDPYNPKILEKEAQAEWDEKQIFDIKTDSSKEKFYCLSMFPYPSGTLHMGHVRCYTLADVIARHQRMLGKNVLHPIGWDAFGMPAENAAIQNNVPPTQWTYDNIAIMREQFKSLGNSYNWQCELATSDPKYYRWEQWFFIQLFNKDLVYKKNALVNWDPVDKTVLANEQVIDGRGWRSGALVEQREIAQWFIKITAYADELLADLDQLSGWPEQVKIMQRNWIGRSEGVEIDFTLQNSEVPIQVYTTRPDTLMGATYLAIAIDHPLAKQAAQQNKNIAAFIESCRKTKVAEAELATQEKRGIATELTASHPITNEPLPIWIANFVLMEYGSGAVMSVPAHDQRDWEFAQVYNLPIKQVITPADGSQADIQQSAFVDKGLLINSDAFDGMNFEQAFHAIADHLSQHNKGSRKVNYRLRDWGVSRQRYWGTPIPIINCPQCGQLPVPEDQLPVVLPEHVDFKASGSPLMSNPEFVNTTCPQCQGQAQRETDTFDTFVESSWYYARFPCADQDETMFDERSQYWLPVDHYVGGIEHAVLHLLYARFFCKLLRDAGLVQIDEPFKNLLTQGMVLKDGHKMSKSKGNTVAPEALIKHYGADTVRLFTVFAAPPDQSLEWSDQAVEGAYRFLKRLWSFAQTYTSIKHINSVYKARKIHSDWHKASDPQQKIRREIHLLLGKACYDYERSQFNTVVSACMKLLNCLQETPVHSTDQFDQLLTHEGFSILLRLLAPITPHICYKLWDELNFEGMVIDAPWPQVISEALQSDTVEYVIQVNGKLRGHIEIEATTDDATIIAQVIACEPIQPYLIEKEIVKTIIIKQRKLINLVVKPRKDS